MDANNILLAPQVADMHASLQQWRDSHFGDMTAFYNLITTPGAGRDAYLNEVRQNIVTSFVAGAAVETIVPQL